MTGTIVALGGGGFSMEPDNPLLDVIDGGLAPDVAESPLDVRFLG